MSSSLCLTQPVPIRPALDQSSSTRDCLELQTRLHCWVSSGLADEHGGHSRLLRDYPGLPKDVNKAASRERRGHSLQETNPRKYF